MRLPPQITRVVIPAFLAVVVGLVLWRYAHLWFIYGLIFSGIAATYGKVKFGWRLKKAVRLGFIGAILLMFLLKNPEWRAFLWEGSLVALLVYGLFRMATGASRRGGASGE